MAMSSWTRSRRRAPRSRPCTASGSPTMAPMRRRGFSEPYGSWNTIWTSRRTARRSRASRSVMSWPSKTIFPSVTGCSRAMQRASVDLPQPVSPTSPSVSPSRICRLTPSTACTNRCSRLTSEALRSGKCLTMPVSSSSAGPASAAADACRAAVISTGTGTRRATAPAAESGSQQADWWPGLAADRVQRRRLGGAPVEGEPAARPERAARRLGQHARRLAGDGPQPPGVAGHRDRLQQPARVGVMRLVVGRPPVGLLDRRAAVHDHDLVGQVGDDAQVVGDQHERGAELALEPDQELEDLGLDGRVQGRGRLVGDDQRRVQGQRHRDHHALAHPAGELVRVVVQALGGPGNADHAEQLDGPAAGRRAADRAVRAHRLGELPAQLVQRVQAGQRVLEDHADALAADLAQLRGRSWPAGRGPRTRRAR